MQADIYFFLMTRLIHHSVFFFHLFLFFLYFFILEFWNTFLSVPSVLFFCFLLCYSVFCSLCLLFNSLILFFLCSLSCYLPLCWFRLFSNDPPYSLNCLFSFQTCCPLFSLLLLRPNTLFCWLIPWLWLCFYYSICSLSVILHLSS